MIGNFGGPADIGGATAVAVVLMGTLVLLLVFESMRWGAIAWWAAIGGFMLGLPLLAMGLPTLALVLLVGSPVVLAVLAWVQPSLVLRYLHWEEYGRAAAPLQPRDVDAERARFATFAGVAVLVGGIAVAVGGWPQGATAGPAGPAAPGGGADAALAGKGKELFARLGCIACHGESGAGTALAPALRAKFGTQEKLADGSSVTFDEGYVRESILTPDAKVVQGFAPAVMAAGIAPHSAEIQKPDSLNALVAFIKSLR